MNQLINEGEELYIDPYLSQKYNLDNTLEKTEGCKVCVSIPKIKVMIASKPITRKGSLQSTRCNSSSKAKLSRCKEPPTTFKPKVNIEIIP